MLHSVGQITRMAGLVAVFLALPGPVLARSAPPQAFHSLRASPFAGLYRPLPAHRPRLHTFHIPSVRFTSNAASRLPLAGVDLKTLQLPSAVWPSGHQAIDGTEMTPSAIDGPNNIFAGQPFHTAAYATGAVQGGYLQQTTFSANRAGDPGVASWLGSVYSNSDGALHMLNNAMSTMKANGISEQKCYLTDEPGCHLYIFPLTLPEGALLTLIYATWTRGNVLGEVLIFAPNYALAHSPEAFGSDLQRLLEGAVVVVAAAAPGSPSTGSTPAVAIPAISISGISVFHLVRGNLKTTASLRLHELGLFAATFNISRSGVYGPAGHLVVWYPHAHVAFMRGGSTLADDSASFEIAPDGTPYFDSNGTFDQKKMLGTLQVRFTLTLGPESDSASRQITITPARKKSAKR